MANASELPTLSTIPQSGSKACNGSKTLNGSGSQANNGSNTCNGSKTCNGCGLCNDGSKMANVNGADVSLPNVDITMLSNIRRSAIASENCAAEDKTCSEDQTTPPSAIVQTPLDNLHINNEGVPSEPPNSVIIPSPSEASGHTEEIVEDGKSSRSSSCICDRPISYVVCMECRRYFQGHALRVCPQHPRRINLMDIAVCPNLDCRCSQLEERSRAPSPINIPLDNKSSLENAVFEKSNEENRVE
ncbi:hypothetical protein Tcan_07692 [Toxocara canis]|uniref:Uncharacterized protein n=1 Tax=Toxocara canis TaxID=6265 RepID=A0A0B2UU47_TOXCA|nr:hypothetical protein Tcan_07692 [Toxocara canis]